MMRNNKGRTTSKFHRPWPGPGYFLRYAFGVLEKFRGDKVNVSLRDYLFDLRRADKIFFENFVKYV